MATKGKKCRFLRMRGRCKMGEACSFRHDDDGKREDACFYHMQQNCRYGDDCRFRHEIVDEDWDSLEEAMAADEDFDVVEDQDSMEEAMVLDGAMQKTPCKFFSEGRCKKEMGADSGTYATTTMTSIMTQ